MVDATRCALEIQRGVEDRNAAVDPNRLFRFRIGIHIGDVVEEADGDLMGDGVNIAARLEGIAKPGAICLSEDAYRQVRNRLTLSIEDLGMSQLKNIAEPVRVFAVSLDPVPGGRRLLKAFRGRRSSVGLALASSVLIAVAIFAVWKVLGSGYIDGPLFAVRHFALPANQAGKPTSTSTAMDAATQQEATQQQTAFELFSVRAASGEMEGQYQLGRLYQLGSGGTPKDAKLAAEWYAKAAEKGHLRAQSALGTLYMFGRGVDRDYGQALRLFRAAAAKNDPDAENGLGLLYRNGWGVTRDYALSVQWFQKAVENGSDVANVNLGTAYEYGWGVATDLKEALRLLRKAADSGNAAAKSQLGTLYFTGLGVQKDFEKAFELFQESAQQRDASGEANLANMLRTSEAHRNYTKAMRMFNRAAAQGNPTAMTGLGVMYLNGEGVPQDEVKAMDWFSRAADLGDGWAMMNIGYVHAYGEGVAQDCMEAKVWFTKALASAAGPDLRSNLISHPACNFDPAQP